MAVPHLVFDEAFQRGLRRSHREPHNTQALVTCQNLRPTQYGLTDFITINQPITAAHLTALGVTPAWPFPQLFRGKSVTLLADATKVFQVTENTAVPWTGSEYVIKNAADIASGAPGNKAITTGGPWHFVDFYDTWMLFNGECAVFKTGYNSAYVFVQDAVTVNTGTAWKEGRALLGGFDSTDFRSAAWQTFWDAYLDNIPTEVANAMDLTAGAGANWVWWSSIGGGDLLWLFAQSIMVSGSISTTPTMGYSATDPFIFDLIRRNEAGMRPMPWKGLVQRMIPMGGAVVVYGADGIALLHSVPGSAMIGMTDLPGIGTRVGIASRSAAGGGDMGQVFVDEAGELWLIRNNYVAERLGYSEYFADMLGNDIVVEFEPEYKEFWISDGTTCYVLTESGLGQAPQMPTTVSFAQGAPIGMVIDPADPTTVEIVTETFNGGDVSVWEIKAVQVVSRQTGWSVAVDYRFRQDADWTRSVAQAVDGRGIARPNVSGIEFRLVLTAADKSGMDLHRVHVRLEDDSKRSIDKWLLTA